MCGEDFFTNAGITVHRRIHTNEKPYKCGQCDNAFADAFWGESLQCEVCSKDFPSRSASNVHRCRGPKLEPISVKQKPLKKSKEAEKVECPICFKTCSAKWNLKTHIATVHEKQRNFVCTLCPQRFGTKGCLDSHVITTHTKEYPFKCETCPAGYRSKINLERHCQTKHEGKRFICEVCKKDFSYEPAFKTHLQTHTADYVKVGQKCEFCGRVYLNRAAFKRHVNKHKGIIENVVCHVCGKNFAHMRFLRGHQKIHTGERNYVCDTCGKRFYNKQALVVHKRVHTKERPYKCQFCQKGFTQRSSLKRHERIHTGERPYKCEICKKGFVAVDVLKAHQCTGYD